MIKRAAIAVCVAVVISLLTIVIWTKQKERNVAQIVRVTEAESYGARSQLVRNIEVMLTALREARRYWENYGHQPREQWVSDAGIELSHFGGVQFILWDDPERGNRYIRTSEHSDFSYRPDDEEWQAYEAIVAKLRDVKASTMLGPFVNDDGRAAYEIYIVDSVGGTSGRVAAMVSAPDSLEPLLRDESPGYAISVDWDDVNLFRRGTAATNAPDAWVRTGLIETSFGTQWSVTHSPTPELLKSLQSLATDSFLLLGLTIAVLLGSLTFENGRARSRAAAAEAAELKLAELNGNLEKEIDDRTRTLANRTAVLQTITDSVSHDLRNPLNSISMNADLLKQHFSDSLKEEHHAVFNRISRGIHQMIEILDRLLGLSAATHSAFEPIPLNMRELIQDLFDELVATEPPPDVHLEMTELPGAFGDRKLVQMLVMNLLANALKFTRGQDERRIAVDFRESDGEVVYSIHDNGIGFDTQHAQDMFAAFRRLENSQESDGHGLGLAIAASVVNRHHGRIWADSKRGEGATFYFTLMPASMQDEHEHETET